MSKLLKQLKTAYENRQRDPEELKEPLKNPPNIIAVTRRFERARRTRRGNKGQGRPSLPVLTSRSVPHENTAQMSSLFEKDDPLLPFPYGTRVKIGRHEVLPSVSYSVTAPRCCELILTFDRAGYNSYDDLYSFCFVSASGEEHWFELGDKAKIKETFLKLLEVVTE